MSQYYESLHRTFLVDAAYARGTRVKLLGTTLNKVTQAGAADVSIGTLTAASFANGDAVDVLLRPYGTRQMVASGAITVNSKVYPDAAGQVTATANGIPEGVALTAASAQGDFIEVLEVNPSGGSGKLYTAVAPSTAVSNTSAGTLFDKNFTIPANLLQAGDRLRIRFAGTATATHTTDTLAIALYIGGTGGTALLSLAARDVANGDLFYGDVDLVVRTAGATGTFVATGTAPANPNAAGTAAAIYLVASTTIDTTATQQIGVAATWSAADVGNSCRLDVLDIDRIPA